VSTASGRFYAPVGERFDILELLVGVQGHRPMGACEKAAVQAQKQFGPGEQARVRLTQ